ncbi:glycosyl transferase family 2 [Priestia taiwanensis]|uniref:Uncharacterized protein n=1 Tax=Priestia taiwanensis TaxID=1347902 RepID=A0A917AIV4_9BACI|nr:glycosyl transferase family 2 [Priestia taiwanensis]MBM7361611.1 hypothetical protein [Priestia taiwanensis]GGE55501.1 hypothetical protein GCM10007140_02340 [Priestia taiwanensis]
MLDKYVKKEIRFDEIVDLEEIYDLPTLLCVELDGTSYEFLLNLKKESNKAIVFGSGAYDAKIMKPPVFQRHSWAEAFNESTIFYNDPTLYLGELNIGWGYGTANTHFLKNIAVILEKLFLRKNILHEHVLFYGSSAGGFMSLMLSGMLEGSTALVNNPQVIFTNFYESHVTKLFSLIHPNEEVNFYKEANKERISVLDFYKKINRVPKIYYLQNISCLHDIHNQMQPFIMGLSKIASDENYSEKVELVLYCDEKKGHNPLDYDETVYYIKKYVGCLG